MLNPYIYQNEPGPYARAYGTSPVLWNIAHRWTVQHAGELFSALENAHTGYYTKGA